MVLALVVTALACLAAVAAGPSHASEPAAAARPAPHAAVLATGLSGIHKLQHIIVIDQENRSFDNYFGTYPGADGIPTDGHGNFTPCLPDPYTGGCQRPYHEAADHDAEAPHSLPASRADVDGGAMDGFVDMARNRGGRCTLGSTALCQDPVTAMGYHDARDIPNYWQYAQHYTLADHVFESTPSFSLPSHQYLTSEWAAICTSSNPFSCTYNLEKDPQVRSACIGPTPTPQCPDPPVFAWTSLPHLLNVAGVSWGYYVAPGEAPDCDSDSGICPVQPQNYRTPTLYNPVPFFTDVAADGTLGNVQDSSAFFPQAAAGTLPAVSWVIPNSVTSEHSPAGIHRGQEWVTKLVNSVMQGPDWASSAIILTWDDWGGYYDHLVPPGQGRTLDRQAGIRVPMIIISPWAKPGAIDSETLSLDSINRLIEDDFLGGKRLDPATDGRPDPRGVVGETRSFVGTLNHAFDFGQDPLPRLVLDPDPPPGPPSCVDEIVCPSERPTITSISPNAIRQGATGVVATVTGTGFAPDATATVTGLRAGDVVTAQTTYVDSKHLRVRMTLKPALPQSGYDLDIRMLDGTGVNCFECVVVTPAPRVTSASPAVLPGGHHHDRHNLRALVRAGSHADRRPRRHRPAHRPERHRRDR
jgi:phospholipase C